METLAIIVAAGRGERMAGDRPKAFLDLAGRPLLLRTVLAFEAAPCVDGIVVVVPGGLEGEARDMLKPVGKLAAVAVGGSRRQDSVLEGLKAAPDDFDGVVLVHDAARPFVDAVLIEAVVSAAREYGAALPVLPIVDTIKRVRDGDVIETLNREELGAAQTPQGFRLELLGRAYEHAFREAVAVTDEAMAVELLGERVVAVAGRGSNLKLTTPADWAWAEGVLAAREARR
jgi:2-C-methyl-D-erythritol 4-phosphate cytidylyltransferase